ncbi:MAG: hypothetical protein ING41_16070 [Burkholderiales bacterium]|jgi:hypothetical protein|nr:hypothetical protein [Burkholderiales bacterium]
MPKPKDTTQITVRLSAKLFETFDEAIERAFLRRDVWLAHILKEESRLIGEELKGLRNSTAARKFIEGQLNERERKALTLTLPADVVSALKVLCDEHGLVRDALFNRLVFMLCRSPLEWAELTGVPGEAVLMAAGKPAEPGPQMIEFTPWLGYSDVVSSTPVALASQELRDPFALHRHVLHFLADDFPMDEKDRSEWQQQSLWKMSLVRPFNGPLRTNLAFLELYLPDELVPGTEAWTKNQADAERLLRTLGGI